MKREIQTQFVINDVVVVDTNAWSDAQVNAMIQRGLNSVLIPRIAVVHNAQRRLAETVENLTNGMF
jgi:hypothetical protein